MANKTQMGIGAVIALLVATYFGVDSNHSNNGATNQPQHRAESTQHNSYQSQNNDKQDRNYTNQNSESNLNSQSYSNSQNQQGLEVIRKAHDSKLSKVQVQSIGKVKAVLRDDNEGSRHQKFILSLDNGLTILVAHNIDLAPKIENLRKGDMVEFFGEYEYSAQGGVIHWTHRDPNHRHEDGWLKHNGKIYQ